MNTPVSLAVVGHTNTGKTSLLRTLLRDSMFGEVQNAAATTRHVEEAAIGDRLRLYDTPGLEDAGGVLDWLDAHTAVHQDGIDRIGQFLHSDAAQHEFAQEAKVLRQLTACDCALYVIDSREPVLPKYKDELTILSWCAKPVMPVFNFTRNQDTGAWQQMLARRYLHVFAEFDTVAFSFEGEIALWHKLATMLPPAQRDQIHTLSTQRSSQWQELHRQALHHIAEFLLETAACALPCTQDNERSSLISRLQERVRSHEQQLHNRLFALYRFYRNEVSGSTDTALNAFARNPFDPDLLAEYGIRAGKAAAAGALIGLGLDALTLGTSLGLGAALGGVIGGVAGGWQGLADKISGIETLFIDDAAITLLAARNLDLLHTLQTRGHAAQSAVILGKTAPPWQSNDLPAPLRQARKRRQWSPLNGSSATQPEKQQAAAELAALLDPRCAQTAA